MYRDVVILVAADMLLSEVCDDEWDRKDDGVFQVIVGILVPVRIVRVL